MALASCLGSYPAHRDYKEKDRMLVMRKLVRAGVTCFVNLVGHGELAQLFDYRADVMKIAQASRQDTLTLAFIHHPIPDGGVCKDEELLNVVNKLAHMLKDGHVVFVHCYGGHGRAGVLCAVLLGLAYRLGAEDALARIQAYHNMREDNEARVGLGLSPQTPVQHEQVTRMLNLVTT